MFGWINIVKVKVCVNKLYEKVLYVFSNKCIVFLGDFYRLLYEGEIILYCFCVFCLSFFLVVVVLYYCFFGL